MYHMNQIHFSQWPPCKFFLWINLLHLGYSSFLQLEQDVLVGVACPVSDQFTTSNSCVGTRQSERYAPPVEYRHHCAFQQIKHKAADMNPASL